MLNIIKLAVGIEDIDHLFSCPGTEIGGREG